jgi:hypothetical protein
MPSRRWKEDDREHSMKACIILLMDNYAHFISYTSADSDIFLNIMCHFLGRWY